MNILIFAGGAGTRLWPLSRKNSPKQFEKIKDGKSTLQLAIDRIRPLGLEHTYIVTNEKYVPIIEDQVPEVPEERVFTEPAKRDLAAAVGLAMCRLKARGQSGPVGILWSDHLMDHPDAFVAALQKAEKMVRGNPKQLVFLSEQPRFANQNLGWIHVGEEKEDGVHAFKGWKYKPELADCEQMFQSGDWGWNPGYFVFDIDCMLELYAALQPQMLEKLQQMVEDESTLAAEYPKIEALHFDKAIIEHVNPADAVVLKVSLGWSDPGTLYALKEAFASGEKENYEQGNVVSVDSKDSFFYNEEAGKVVCGLGLEGMMVVNTKDTLFVCHKDDVPRIKEMLGKLENEGKSELL